MQVTLRREVDGFVKQRGHYLDHPVSIRLVLVLVEGGRTHLILSAIALTTPFHLVRFAASSSSNPILFKFSSTCSSISALAYLDFAAHLLQASMPSLERYHHLSKPLVHTTILHLSLPFYLIFPTNPASSSTPHYSFYPLISLHTLISAWHFPFFLRLSSRFPSNIICISFGNDKAFISSTLRILLWIWHQ